jgi:NADH-quinone oxidoreductase subunit J
MEVVVFALAAAAVLAGGLGVILARNPVHSALALVGSFFGIAVLFVDLDAHFLAAVQVIVYAGAIVVLFLFVIMLLGVDQAEDLSTDPIAGQRPGAGAAGVGLLGVALAVLLISRASEGPSITGTASGLAAITAQENIEQLGEVLFTQYLFAFEITSVLLVIAVVAAVTLARTPRRRPDELEAEGS